MFFASVSRHPISMMLATVCLPNARMASTCSASLNSGVGSDIDGIGHVPFAGRARTRPAFLLPAPAHRLVDGGHADHAANAQDWRGESGPRDFDAAWVMNAPFRGPDRPHSASLRAPARAPAKACRS